MLTQGNLHGYQLDVIQHLIDCPRAHTFADMGLGKTVSVLTAFEAARLAGDAERLLVLAPLRVATTVWPREPGNWQHLSHLHVQPIIGTPKQRAAAIQRDADVYTVNYENLIWLVEQHGKKWPYDWVVADESTRLKKPSGKRFRAAKRVHKLPSRWTNLTGTPAPNGLIDLWAPTYLLDSGQRLYKTFGAFKGRWFDENPYSYKIEPKQKADDEIRECINDVTLSVRAEDHVTTEEPVSQTIRVELPSKARRTYRDMESSMIAELESADIEALNAGVATMKCRQLASGAAYTDTAGNWERIHDAKLEALQSVIEEAAGEPILVAYHFRSTAERVQKAIPSARRLDTHAETERDWNQGQIPLLLAHPASAGHGLNLQHGGRRVVWFDLDWDLELYQQLIERIGPVRQRQAGYQRTVYIHHLVAADTIDEAVIDRLNGKATTQDALRQAMRQQLTSLNTARA